MQRESITHLRTMIDMLDGEIVNALNRRAACALRLGSLKRALGEPAFDATRETEVLERVVEKNRGPLSSTAIRDVYSEVMSACRALQAPTSVGFLGPAGTFSEQAALKRFGHGVDQVSEESIEGVFVAVESGRADFGVVPVENTTEGPVNATLDRLAVTSATIQGELDLEISHSLISRESRVDEVKTVYSHPQALGQCGQWLARNLPGRALIPVSGTSAGAMRAAKEPQAACVGSEALAAQFGMRVLASSIQDGRLNVTRFLVIGAGETQPSGHDKTSIVFSVSHRPGALFRALEIFSRGNVNLLKIESRPAKHTPWEYIFFTDFEGHAKDEIIVRLLDELAASVTSLKTLGSYPACRRSRAAARPADQLAPHSLDACGNKASA
jgi:chorismate mutase / prephenate dehydratase